MSDYALFLDGFSDIPRETEEQWNVKIVRSHMHFEGDEKEYRSDELTAAQFYGRLRAGERAGTSGVNMTEFLEPFELTLQQGLDILYLGFSSGLSSTYSAGVLAAEELREKYPRRSIITVDTLLASTGYGMLAGLVAQKRQEGASLQEAAAFAEKTKLSVCSWFTVDDMSSLLRGGRVVSVLANLGGRLNIKPVLHMDNAGHLIPVMVSRGRKKSLMTVAEQYGKLALEPGAAPVYMCHGDCREDADYLARLLEEQYGAKVELIADCGPAIGAHTGPGVISLFFLGRER